MTQHYDRQEQSGKKVRNVHAWHLTPQLRWKSEHPDSDSDLLL
jgi:hypothetical protein